MSSVTIGILIVFTGRPCRLGSECNKAPTASANRWVSADTLGRRPKSNDLKQLESKTWEAVSRILLFLLLSSTAVPLLFLLLVVSGLLPTQKSKWVKLLMLMIGDRWTSVDLSGSTEDLRGPQWRTSVDLRGPQWISVDLRGLQWISEDLNGSQRTSVDLSGPQWTWNWATGSEIHLFGCRGRSLGFQWLCLLLAGRFGPLALLLFHRERRVARGTWALAVFERVWRDRRSRFSSVRGGTRLTAPLGADVLVPFSSFFRLASTLISRSLTVWSWKRSGTRADIWALLTEGSGRRMAVESQCVMYWLSSGLCDPSLPSSLWTDPAVCPCLSSPAPSLGSWTGKLNCRWCGAASTI